MSTGSIPALIFVLTLRPLTTVWLWIVRRPPAFRFILEFITRLLALCFVLVLLACKRQPAGQTQWQSRRWLLYSQPIDFLAAWQVRTGGPVTSRSLWELLNNHHIDWSLTLGLTIQEAGFFSVAAHGEKTLRQIGRASCRERV